MEDADLEEIKAKRLAQLQSEYKVNYKFSMTFRTINVYWHILHI
jgi:DNA-binding TFAR19-related protein (PDSD5 family)